MWDHLGFTEPARELERAVRVALSRGECTADVGGKLGTEACGRVLEGLVAAGA
jgi:hypothetical protein